MTAPQRSTSPLCVLDTAPPGPFQVVHPHPNLRFALNECNGSYWLPGRAGRWEVAPTPFGALSVRDAFELASEPPRLTELAAYASALESPSPASPTVDESLLRERGAITTPWAHQKRTLEWLLGHTQLPGSGALLYLGLGTGKTRICLDWVRLKHIRRTLVVAPLAVLPAWEAEAKRHYGSTFDVWVAHRAYGGKAEHCLKFLSETTKPAIVVLNYDIAWRKEFARLIETSGFDCVICDESSRLKGRSSKRSLYFRSAWKRHPYRIALTGTPLSNGVLTDAFGIFAFLDPGIYGGSITRFEERFVVKDRRQQWLVLGYRNVPEFYRRFWWVTKHEDRSVLTLPPTTESIRSITLPPDARRAYAQMRDELIVRIKEGVVTASNAGVALMKLQQMTGGSVLATDGSVLRVHQEKQNALVDVLRETGSEPVVVFCLFRADLAAVHDAARTVGLESLELSGSRRELERWQGGEATVLAVQYQSGSEGISLVRAAVAVFWSPTYALSQFDQAKARLSRPGQERPVAFVHLLAEGTIDQQVTRALDKKQNFVTALLDSRGELLRERDESV